jgi:hypothetical protein
VGRGCVCVCVNFFSARSGITPSHHKTMPRRSRKPHRSKRSRRRSRSKKSSRQNRLYRSVVPGACTDPLRAQLEQELKSKAHFEHRVSDEWRNLLSEADIKATIDRLMLNKDLCRTLVPPSVFVAGAAYEVDEKRRYIHVTYPDHYNMSVKVKLRPRLTELPNRAFLPAAQGTLENSISHGQVDFHDDITNRTYVASNVLDPSVRGAHRWVLIPVSTLQERILRRKFASSEDPLVFHDELNALLPPSLTDHNIVWGMGRDLQSFDPDTGHGTENRSMCGVLWGIKLASETLTPMNGETLANFTTRFEIERDKYVRKGIHACEEIGW